MNWWTDALGWVGSAMIFIAYFLVSRGKVTGQSIGYQLTNTFGASGMAVNACAQSAWPIFALELIWAGVAVFTLAATARKPATEQKPS